MIRSKRTIALWAAAMPLAWVLSGCGGDKPAAKPATSSKDTTTTTTTTATPEKDKGDAKPAAKVEGWGDIKGRIVYDGEAPKPVILVKQGDKEVKNFERCAAHDLLSEELVVNQENHGIKWSLVYINRPPGIHPDLEKGEGEAEFGQEFCAFKPHLLAYRAGQPLVISSSDPIGHNTHVRPGKNPEFNEMLESAPEGGKSKKPPLLYKAEAKPFAVKCDVHSWMSANIYVSDHPYFAVTNENGEFEIKKVPAGKLKLVVWQEKLGYGEGKQTGKEIEVKADATTDLKDIKMK